MKTVIEIHNHFSKLFKAFAILSPSAIARELHSVPVKMLFRGEYNDFDLYLQHTKAFLKRSELDSARRTLIKSIIIQFEAQVARLYKYPEQRPILLESDKYDLRVRLYTLLYGEDATVEAHTWASSGHCTIAHLEENAPVATDIRTQYYIKETKQSLSMLEIGQSKMPSILEGPAKLKPLPVPVTKHEKSSFTLVDRIITGGVTLDKADQLARVIGLVGEDDKFKLGERKLGAVVGFCQALKLPNKLTSNKNLKVNLDDLIGFFGERYGVQIKTRKTGTDVALQYRRLTEKALADL